MKFLGISLCMVSLAFAGSVAIDPLENLEGYIFEQLSEHKEAFQGWLPAMVNSPLTHTRVPQPRIDLINCQACRIVIDMLKTLRRLGISKLVIQEGVITVCRVLQIVPDPLCRKTVNHFADTIVRILDDTMGMVADDFCGIVNYKCGNVNSSLTDWEIIMDTNKPPVTVLPPLPSNIPAVKIMHLTDVHLDLHYVEGNNGECGQPAGCCHEEHGEGTGSGRAGKFGHFDCSMARPALDALFEHAKATHENELSMVFLTGDYVYSAIWENSVPSNSRHIEYVTTHLENTFPDVKTYPVVGNHEGNVCNNYPPESLWSEGVFDLSWLYKLFSEPFMKWIPEDQLPAIMRGGYYTVKPDPTSPLRIVVINSNLCYLLNFWTVYDTIDPAGQLQWLADTLFAAEQAGEVVYIVGHIPPGSEDCWPVWSEKFDRIVNRFEGLIKGQWYGHIHNEYFILNHDGEKPIGVSYPGPSGVPSGGHTSYKIFLADGARGAESTWELIDHETYLLNLTSSNEAGEANWLKLHSAKENFGLQSLRPADLYDFVLRMITDDDLFHRYLVVYHKARPNIPPCTDLICRAGYLCDLVISNSGDETPCDRIRELMGIGTTTTTNPGTTTTGNPGTTTTGNPGTTTTGNPGTTTTGNPGTTTSRPVTTTAGVAGSNLQITFIMAFAIVSVLFIKS